MDILRLSAFPRDGEGGNPAGVVIGAAHPSVDEMQRIATEIGYSETAFIARTGAREAHVRYFSPQKEVPFCGHATIASAVALAEADGAGPFLFKTASGDVAIETAEADGAVTATLTSVDPRVEPAGDELVAAALGLLGWKADDLDPQLTPALAFAGAWHLIIAVSELATLSTLDYDFDGLRNLMEAHDLTTFQLVWHELPRTFRSRNPFPVGGVREDPATGAAAAAFGAYLRDRGAIVPPATFTIEQGVEMGSPSRLVVELVAGQPGVRVTGTAAAITT